MAAIEFDHVTKRFSDGTVAVDDLVLEARDGEFLILVVTSGEIRIGGRVVNDLEPPDRDVAMVFQTYALYPHMTVADNIGFPLRMQNFPRKDTSERVHKTA